MTDYFETIGIPIVQGRAFQPSDSASPGPVAVVNETLVNTFWKEFVLLNTQRLLSGNLAFRKAVFSVSPCLRG